jgi:hypothetical protein
MKTLRQICMASVFTFALALPVLAGEITTMVVQPPPPPPADGEISTPAKAGEIHTGAPGEISTTQAALNLLQDLLGLL